MKPPECRVCGVEEWRHVCAGVTNAAVLATKPVSNAVSNDKRNDDRHKPGYMRGYMRAYMLAWRAIDSGRACRWPRGA